MSEEATLSAMREALQAALQSHVRMGKARLCECSLCLQIRDALKKEGGAAHADRLREECAQVADWKASQIETSLTDTPPDQQPTVRIALKTARDIADRIRVLKGRKFA